MSFYLAVDAGGTKTEFLLGTETLELARARTGTIKRMRTDAESATRNLETGLTALTSQTGVPMHSVTATCIGAAGSSVPLVADWMRAAFGQRVSGLLDLVGDVEIALDAAFAGAPGVVAIAGTGSNVAGRNTRGAVTTVGGWGPVLADQASGHRVGLQALRALFLALDEGRSTTLLEAVLSRWGLDSMHRIVEVAHQHPTPDFSELAPVVVACAEAGDRVAQAVLDREAQELAHLVLQMVERVASSSDDSHWLPEVAFAGSMLEHVPLLRASLVAALHRTLPRLNTREGVVDPILGALWRARSRAAAHLNFA